VRLSPRGDELPQWKAVDVLGCSGPWAESVSYEKRLARTDECEPQGEVGKSIQRRQALQEEQVGQQLILAEHAVGSAAANPRSRWRNLCVPGLIGSKRSCVVKRAATVCGHGNGMKFTTAKFQYKSIDPTAI